MQKSIKAYTLIELAIVFTIIGMLIGGSLYGAYLVQTANLRSVIADFKKIEAVVQGFTDTYQALPGDFSNAGNVWGTACDATPANCNGNGDGLITMNGSATANEYFRSWQHLALSGFYPNNLTGMPGVAGSNAADVTNSLSSKVSGGLYIIVNATLLGWFGFTTGDGNNSYNFIGFGKVAGNNYPWYAVLSTNDAQELDNKIDDGIPTLGRIYGVNGSGSCGSGSSATATYNLLNAGILCTMFYRLLPTN